ncbi:MAG: hypothetical protein HUU04_09495 [Verrucomicrobiae bacterium]|nr:hypothetical protein [Verrucomicrobiae bacterium]
MKTTLRARALLLVLIAAAVFPVRAQYTANDQTNTISGGLTGWTGNYIVGSNTVFDVLQILGGGVLTNANGYLGYETVATNNLAIVDGGGSTWSNVGSLFIGNRSSGNQLILTNGGRAITTANGYVGTSLNSASNRAVVAGNGSTWTIGGSYLHVGQNGANNQLMILDGGQVFVTGASIIGQSGPSVSNLVVVSGANSLWTNGSTLYVGGNNTASAAPPGPTFSMLVVSNGGAVRSAGAIIGNSTGANFNVALVTGNGSSWSNISGAFTVGAYGAGNLLIVSNRGYVYSGNSTVAGYAVGTNNEVRITGEGSFWRVNGTFYVGSNTSSKGSGRVLVTDGGMLQVVNMYGGWEGSGVISNIGGIFQFGATPTITPNGAGNIVVTNGTIAHTGTTAADVRGSYGANQIGNILFQGANTFRLNTASNTAASAQNYTFAAGISPSNYVALEMINGGTAWKSAWLNVGSGGSLLVSNSTASIEGVLTNSGSIRVVNGSATWQNHVVLDAGSYTFAGATNTFAAGLQIGASALLGGSGRLIRNGTVTNSGTLSPGNSPGTMVFSSNLDLQASSVLVLEIGGAGWNDYDHLVVEGTLTKGGSVVVTNLGYTFLGGESFDFVDATNLAGAFGSLSLPSLTGGMTWDTSLFESQGLLSVIAIPEPTTFLAILISLGGLALAHRRGRLPKVHG